MCVAAALYPLTYANESLTECKKNIQTADKILDSAGAESKPKTKQGPEQISNMLRRDEPPPPKQKNLHNGFICITKSFFLLQLRLLCHQTLCFAGVLLVVLQALCSQI